MEFEPKISILLVDDNAKNLFSLRSILETEGYQLIQATSGPQALKALLQQDFAVILMDVLMPGMDGIETARLIRERTRTCQVPIIFITSISQDDPTVFAGYEVGAVDYITTPIRPEILKAKISVFVDLFRKTEKLKRQAEMLQQAERQKYEKELEAQKRLHDIQTLQIREEHLLREKESEMRNAQLLEIKARELERSNADLERFAFAASHDMQEPLRTIIAYSQLLQRANPEKFTPDEREFIDFVVNGASRMQQMIRSLLDYSLLSREPRDTVKDIDCQKLFENITDSLHAAIEESEAEVLADDLPLVRGEESQINQLFLNLISNAIKFRGERPPKIHVHAQEQGDSWLFCVSDNGIGIEPKYFDQIFGLFKRLHGRERYAGSGLGLSLCKKIVENHRGRIWVESNPGSGSRFYFTLPRPAEVHAVPEELLAQAAVTGSIPLNNNSA